MLRQYLACSQCLLLFIQGLYQVGRNLTYIDLPVARDVPYLFWRTGWVHAALSASRAAGSLASQFPTPTPFPVPLCGRSARPVDERSPRSANQRPGTRLEQNNGKFFLRHTRKAKGQSKTNLTAGNLQQESQHLNFSLPQPGRKRFSWL